MLAQCEDTFTHTGACTAVNSQKKRILIGRTLSGCGGLIKYERYNLTSLLVASGGWRLISYRCCCTRTYVGQQVIMFEKIMLPFFLWLIW